MVKNSMNSFDYIVVGGGTAGCVIASRLTENDSTRVLLVAEPVLESRGVLELRGKSAATPVYSVTLSRRPVRTKETA